MYSTLVKRHEITSFQIGGGGNYFVNDSYRLNRNNLEGMCSKKLKLKNKRNPTVHGSNRLKTPAMYNKTTIHRVLCQTKNENIGIRTRQHELYTRKKKKKKQFQTNSTVLHVIIVNSSDSSADQFEILLLTVRIKSKKKKKILPSAATRPPECSRNII